MLVAGCAGSSTGGEVPESASLAPEDATAYLTVEADEGSTHWEQAEALLDRFDGARDGLASGVDEALGAEGLTWEDDFAPAFGPEVVIVVTADHQFVFLTQPEDEAKLEALFDRNLGQVSSAEIDGWTAFTEGRSTLAAYQAALARGTLRDDDAFVEGMASLPSDSLVRVWVDVSSLSDELDDLVEQTSSEVDLGIDWLSAALSAEEDGVLLTVGARTPGGADTHYEPKLFDQVPADAVAALSFGGTQGILDSVQGSVDVDEISDRLEGLTGLSLDGLVDALSGEGVLYLRPSENIPEVTVALAPPDPDETWETLGRLARTHSEQTDTPITTVTENGVEVRRIAADEGTISFARLDEDTMIVTTGPDAISAFQGDGDKLVDAAAFRDAADAVALGDRTKGFLYVDLDGLIPFVESFAPEAVAQDGREVLESLDSLILQASGDGETTTFNGFLRVTG
jgi:Protein of unknown function (DUF3352)